MPFVHLICLPKKSACKCVGGSVISCGLLGHRAIPLFLSQAGAMEKALRLSNALCTLPWELATCPHLRWKRVPVSGIPQPSRVFSLLLYSGAGWVGGKAQGTLLKVCPVFTQFNFHNDLMEEEIFFQTSSKPFLDIVSMTLFQYPSLEIH